VLVGLEDKTPWGESRDDLAKGRFYVAGSVDSGCEGKVLRNISSPFSSIDFLRRTTSR
jgi:hypothetical protein